MNRTILIILTLFAVLCASLVAVIGKKSSRIPHPPLLLHCAAGLRNAVSEIALNYEKETNVPVQIQFGGSGALEAQLEVAGGDLFLPADSSYLDSIAKKGLLEKSFPAVSQTAGIVVPKGNPRNLQSLGDLSQPGLRLSMADSSAAIGKHVREVLAETGDLAAISKNITVTKPTVNNTVEDVATGAVDATLAWDAVARDFTKVEWLPVPVFSEKRVETAIAVLTTSKHQREALRFARYLTDPEKGQKIFKKYGFTWAKEYAHD